MLIRNRIELCYLIVVTACLTAASSANAQHVHGVIEVGVVVEDSELAVSLDAPLDDAIGFEHKPKTDAQKEMVEKLAASLSDAGLMFATPEAAGCEVRSVTVEGPGFLTMHLSWDESHDEAADRAHKEHHHDDHHDDDLHDDGHHDDHHDDDHHDEGHHDDHHDDDHHDDAHSEIVAEYLWACADPSALVSITPLFVKVFHQVEKIKLQILTSTGASVVDADSSLKSISLKSP